MESSENEDIPAELPAKKQFTATINAAFGTPTAPYLGKKTKLDLRNTVRITAQPGIKLSRAV